MNTTNTNKDSLLTHNQKTGLAITGFSLLIGAMVFLVGTGVLILSMFLFGLGVYMFFKKDKEIEKEPLIQTKENYFYQKPLFETGQEEDLETLMKEAEEEPYFYVKPLFETKREKLEKVLSMLDDHDPTDLITDPAFSSLCGNIFYHHDDDYDNKFFEDD
jgi:hypothetical protein